RPALAGAFTFRGPADSDAFRRILDEAEGGRVKSIAFVLPASGVWPLPLYELALLTATHLGRQDEVRLELVTPEPAPLSLFGDTASEAVRELLKEHGIGLHTSCYPVRYEAGRLELVPERTLHADRVVALPRLEGRRILGLAQDTDGFIPTDLSGRVQGLPHVYAAGDITRFPIKQGGTAAQQADAVAEATAPQAGAAVKPRVFEPVLRGLLLTGGPPRFLRRELHGSGDTGAVTGEALWWPPSKTVGRYLA